MTHLDEHTNYWRPIHNKVNSRIAATTIAVTGCTVVGLWLVECLWSKPGTVWPALLLTGMWLIASFGTWATRNTGHAMPDWLPGEWEDRRRAVQADKEPSL
jgi:hypothetical protein